VHAQKVRNPKFSVWQRIKQ